MNGNVLTMDAARPQVKQSHSRYAAYAAFEEDMKVTITAGRLADLVILDKGPRKVPASRISRIQVLLTMVGGKFAYDAKPSSLLRVTK